MFAHRPGCPGQVIAVVMATAFCTATATAQTYYKWTDERGTVHLSDQPPPRGKAEERVLVPPRQAPAAVETPSGEGTPEERRSPAAVTIEKQEVTRLGPNSVRVVGELQNMGGSPAEGIAVVVKANDAVQGNPCLEREIIPSPKSLGPREKASFEAEITDPCLFGDPPVELSVRWEEL